MPTSSYTASTFAQQLEEQKDSLADATSYTSSLINATSPVIVKTSQYNNNNKNHRDDYSKQQISAQTSSATTEKCDSEISKAPPTSNLSSTADKFSLTSSDANETKTTIPNANQEADCESDPTKTITAEKITRTTKEGLVSDAINDDNDVTRLGGSTIDVVTILHFNDCYNIESGPHSSGAAGFLTAINQYRHLNPMILFSGDIISPSFISTFTKGEQMIPVLNDIGVHCAVFGNHEFDYGVDNLIEFVKKTTFPWLLSNVVDKETSNQLGDGKMYHIIESGGLKFGIIGLIEEEWLSTLSTIDSCDVIYEDFVVKGRELALKLKSAPYNVDYVIALTHFRKPNDIRLADNVPEIDLILGGHDHDYEIINRPNGYIIKSGTDFREFSLITLKINPDYVKQQHQQQHSHDNSIDDVDPADATSYKKTESEDKKSQEKECMSQVVDISPAVSKECSPISYLDIERVSCFGYPPNEELEKKLDKFVKSIDEKMGKVLGQFSCDLDGRFASIRNHETNLGNFVTDIMLASTHADLAILNSGTLRSDQIHPKGDFTMRDLFKILGFIDPIAVLNASGYQIWKALENGVSQWPKLEGRFPQVSGCSFTFDPSKPSSQRIDPKDIFIGDEQLQLDKQYKLTTKDYLASGKDGYDMLKECEVLLPGDESPDLTTSILNHFEAINIIKSNRRTRHRQSIICLSRNSIQKMLHSQNSISADGSASDLSAQFIGEQNATKSRDDTSSGVVIEGHSSESKEESASSTMRHSISTIKTNIMHHDNNNNEKSDHEDNASAHQDQSSGVVATRTNSNLISDDDNDELIKNESLDTFDPVMMAPSLLSGGGLSKLVGAHSPLASSPLLGTIAPKPKLVAQQQTTPNSTLSSTTTTTPAAGTDPSSSHRATIKSISPETPAALSMIDKRIVNDNSSNLNVLSHDNINDNYVGSRYRQPRSKRLMSLDDLEHEQCKLNPQVEGRIRIVGIHVRATNQKLQQRN